MFKPLKLNKSKKAFDLPFSWVFSIIAGAFILFIAIYAATSIVKGGQQVGQAESAQKLLNYLNPAVNGITSSSKLTSIVFKRETRIAMSCSESSSKSPFFGRQTINFSEQTGFLSKWSQQSESVSRYNKYIFSNSLEEGKTFYLFVKPFYMGFKVDDLVFLNAQKYCFIEAPTNINQEIKDLELDNVNLSESVGKCSNSSIKVCFGTEFSGCNITVYGTCNSAYCKSEYDSGYIINQDETLNYIGSLIYAGIFSSPEIYECNVKRLAKKASELSQIYIEKIGIIKQSGCDSIIEPNLQIIKDTLDKTNSSLALSELMDIIADMDDKTRDTNMDCRVYTPNSEEVENA